MRRIRFCAVFVLILCFSAIIAGCFSMPGTAPVSAGTGFDDDGGPAAAAGADLWDDLSNLLWPKKEPKKLENVVLGGIPIGIALEDKGVQIIGFTEISTAEGKKCPATEKGLKVGDRIISVDGQKVTRVTEVSDYAEKSGGTPLALVYIRNDKTETVEITPVRDSLTKNFRLGILAKEGCNGIGTLTFMRRDLTFGCLGHPMTANDTHEIIEIDGGSVFACRILDVKKGAKGAAGELKGAFTGKQSIGEIYKNNKYGVYGKYTSVPKCLSAEESTAVLPASKVTPGRAQIITTINGESPKRYDIEIVKASGQSEKDEKGLVIRITDKELLQAAGGIVQGMSGSPIIQNGALAGAVTHVFINDPTRGYGIFAEWMLSE